MPMVITIAKHRGKPPTLSCRRTDGSVTWQSYGSQGGFFPRPRPDPLRRRDSPGATATRSSARSRAGRDLGDFGPGDAAAFHPEMVQAELVAGLLTASEGAGSRLSREEIVTTVNGKMAERGMPPVELGCAADGAHPSGCGLPDRLLAGPPGWWGDATGVLSQAWAGVGWRGIRKG